MDEGSSIQFVVSSMNVTDSTRDVASPIVTMKSSGVRSRSGVPRLSVTRTSTSTRETVIVSPNCANADAAARSDIARSEEHTSEPQSQSNLVCRLLLEKKK